MARSPFVRFGGLASLLGGILWVVAMGAAQLEPSQLVGVVALPSLCLALGVIALQRRRVTLADPISNLAFVFALVGALLLAYGSTGRLVYGGEIGGQAFGPFVFTGVALGALVFGLGTAVIAVSAILADVVPRLSPIPLLVGAIGVTIAGGLGLVRQLQDGPANDVFPFHALPLLGLWVLFGAGWLWLGYLLFTERRHVPVLGADGAAPPTGPATVPPRNDMGGSSPIHDPA